MTNRLSAAELAALDALLDAIEHARSAPEDDALAEATLSASMQFLSEVAGAPIARALIQQGRATAPASENGGRDPGAFVAGVLARLVHGAAPLLHQVSEQFPVEPVVRDLLQSAQRGGASPLIMPIAKRGPGQRDHRDRKRAAQRCLVLAIYREAGRTGTTIDTTRERLGLDIDANRSSWSRWLETVPPDEREAARREGAGAAAAHPDLDPATWRELMDQATAP